MALIETRLLVDSPKILQGLQQGTLERYGSVIRHAPGTPLGGQIVKHLTEVPRADFAAPNLSPALSRPLGLMQVAAGASVLNLGVSVVGFAYMGYKLHQVQKALGQLQETMAATLESLAGVHRKLDAIAGQLNYLCWLVQDNRQQQEKLAQAIAYLQKALLLQSLSELQANLDYFSVEAWRETAICAAKTRLFLSSQVLHATPKLDAELMLSTDLALQGWAVATATEAQVQLQTGQHRAARQLLAEEVPKFRQAAQQWCRALVQDEENPVLRNAHLFGAKPFRGAIAPERVQRIVSISPLEANQNPDQIRWQQHQLAVEFEMSYAADRYPVEWVNRKIAVAEYLDTLSELTARLDTLQSFAELCEATGVRSSRELLPADNTPAGLYVI